MKSAVLLIDKPEGMSSAQVVGAARKRLGIKKIGHAGTLDPMATGLLVLLTNRATRLAQYAEAGSKIYSGTIQLGVRSDSDDVTGALEKSDQEIPAFTEIETAVQSFLGEIEQVPPKISAVKINGKRAYKRARAGESFEIKKRSVRIDSYDIKPVSADVVSFKITCSKGTYIRSLARDLGEMLGCGGCLASLRREASFPFSATNAVSLEDLDENALVDWDTLFPGVERMMLPVQSCEQLLQGDLRGLSTCEFPEEQQKVLYCDAEKTTPLGLLEKSDKEWKIAVNLGFSC